jgi:hypothetical protein
MQDEGRRSVRLVANAISRNESALRPWKVKFAWDARIAREGASSQARAVQIYREAYYATQAMREVSTVEPNMRIAFLVSSPPPSATTGIGDAARGENQRISDSPAPADSDAKKALDALRRHGTILDALLAMREDAEEIASILRALEASAGVEREFDGIAKGPARLRAVNETSDEEAVLGDSEAG